MLDSLTMLRRIADLMEQRERQLAEAGEWKRVDWEWRQQWRADAASIGVELERLGRGL